MAALSSLRSVRGLELAVSAGLLTLQANAETALRAAGNPITQAFLLPFAPKLEAELPANEILPPPFRQHLKLVGPLCARHLVLVEAVRLRYKRAMQEIDRKEKDEHRKSRRQNCDVEWFNMDNGIRRGTDVLEALTSHARRRCSLAALTCMG